AEGLNFAVFDPSYFIDFEPEKTDAVKLADAPQGCTATILDPDAEKNDAEAKRLGAAMAQQFGAASVGFGSYKTIAVGCKKSGQRRWRCKVSHSAVRLIPKRRLTSDS